MVTRWSEKSPGLKVLWLWTLGTAAILMTNVVRTTLRDMEKSLNKEDAIQSEAAGHPAPIDEVLKEE
ncbi:hypothetical protein IEQ34_008965 [Dendrobium chrysotoxum]|nr:hypothetical protein IEQ34_008965 [Dendrobium chrysotoxum]